MAIFFCEKVVGKIQNILYNNHKEKETKQSALKLQMKKERYI